MDSLAPAAKSEMAVALASMIVAGTDNCNADSISAVVASVGIDCEPYWPMLVQPPLRAPPCRSSLLNSIVLSMCVHSAGADC